MTDILSQLSAFSWTSGGDGVKIEFPVSEMTMGFTHDMKEHKFWGLDGAEVEATGRNPLAFTAKCLFSNHITPGPNEHFSVLYPSEFRKFILGTSDRATGILNHPEFGPISCKTVSVHVDWRAGLRDGCAVDAAWIETLDQDTLSKVNNNKSPVNNVQTFAGDLDRQLGGTIFASEPAFKPDFVDSITSILSVTDQVGIQSARIVGKIDNLSYRLNQIKNSVSFAITPPRTSVASIVNPDPSQTNRALTTMYWPIRQSVNQMQSSLEAFKEKLLETGKPIVFYRVPKTTTLAGVTVATGASIFDIMNLNPSLMSKAYLPTGTLVRYYSKANRA